MHHWVGRKHTEESRRKMSLARRGKKHAPTFVNRKHSEKTKEKMRASAILAWKKTRHKRVGENNPNWRGGITKERTKVWRSKEYQLWREAVFKRDNYTCIIGGKSHGNKLQADHIKPFAHFPELRFAIDNGRTLCIDCHKKTDTYMAKARWHKY